MQDRRSGAALGRRDLIVRLAGAVLFPAMTTAGAGVLDLPRILGHARRAGVEHLYVEQDLAANPPEQLGATIR